MKVLKTVLISALAASMLLAGVGCNKVDDRDPNTLTIAYAKSGYGGEWLENAL